MLQKIEIDHTIEDAFIDGVVATSVGLIEFNEISVVISVPAGKDMKFLLFVYQEASEIFISVTYKSKVIMSRLYNVENVAKECESIIRLAYNDFNEMTTQYKLK